MLLLLEGHYTSGEGGKALVSGCCYFWREGEGFVRNIKAVNKLITLNNSKFPEKGINDIAPEPVITAET